MFCVVYFQQKQNVCMPLHNERETQREWEREIERESKSTAKGIKPIIQRNTGLNRNLKNCDMSALSFTFVQKVGEVGLDLWLFHYIKEFRALTLSSLSQQLSSFPRRAVGARGSHERDDINITNSYLNSSWKDVSNEYQHVISTISD